MILALEQRVEDFLRNHPQEAHNIIEILNGTLGMANVGDPRIRPIEVALDNLIVKGTVIGKDFPNKPAYDRYYYILHPRQV